MIKILFIGDINGKIGRETVKKILPKIKSEYHPDLVFANAENAAHGAGVTEATIKELLAAGIDHFTTGDHAFDAKQLELFDKYPILRPANFLTGVPGHGYKIIEWKNEKILLINALGQVFMPMNQDNPFHKLDEILAKHRLSEKKLSAIIVDIHAEATSEKIALKHYLNGRVSAVLGTHTHVMTADAQITDKGTAYITDTGMAGAAEECIGVAKEGIIKTFLTQIRSQHVIPETGPSIFNAVLIEINERTGRAKSIKPITKHLQIK
jgi:metallophosphoesterase (TIGR00282 family)